MAPLTSANETLNLTITLPKDVAQHLRDQVAKGRYASESEYIQSILQSETLFDPVDQNELTHWIETEGVRRFDAMRADPSSALTEAEAFAGLCNEEEEEE